MKKFLFGLVLVLFQLSLLAQTNLPTSWNFSSPGIGSPPVGWTLGLGTNGNLTYAFGIGDNLSCRLDATNEYVLIQIADKPGALSYYLSPQNAGAAWGGQFDVQESSNGTTWTTLRSVTSKANSSTNYNNSKYTDFPSASARYIRFFYTQKLPGGVSGVPGGNMGLDSVLIQAAPAPPSANIFVFKNAAQQLSGGNTVIGTSASSAFTIENRGTAQSLSVDSIVFYGDAKADFSVAGLPLLISASSSVNISVLFTAGAQGSRKAQMKIFCNDSLKNPFVLNLYGIGGTVATEPSTILSNLTFTNLKPFGFVGNYQFSAPGPEKFMVLKKQGGAITDAPVDGSTYNVGDYIGSSQVLYISDSAMAISPTYILANTQYSFACYSFNGPAGYENYHQSGVISGTVTSTGRSFGNYYQGINPNNPNFVSSLSAKINPHDTIYYSNYISRLVNPWLTRDTSAGKKVVTCVYTNHQFLYNEPFLWANGNNGAVLTREHTWPQSWMPSNSGNPDWPNAVGTTKELPEYNDLHNLFPAHQANANARRSNNPFDEVVTATYTSPTGFGVVGKDSSNRTAYEPRAEQKGDIARALFYMAACYHGIGGRNWSIPVNQNLALLREWHRQDPPSSMEIARNEFIAVTQGNRNPFIDFPEWADRINFSNMTYVADTAASGYIKVLRPTASDIWMKRGNAVVTWDALGMDSLDVFFSMDSLKSLILLGRYSAQLDSVSAVIASEFVVPTGIVLIKAVGLNLSDTSDYFKLSMVDFVEAHIGSDRPNIYPNPFEDFITLSGGEFLSEGSAFEIYNFSGERVKEGTYFWDLKLDTRDLSRGLYFIKLTNEKSQFLLKMIKQ
jgi:endonuclease I